LFEGQSVLYPNMEGAQELLNRLRELVAPTDGTATPEGPAPNTVRVRVFNGSGVNGAAGEASEVLGGHGFRDGGTGNNPENIDETEVRYRPGSEAKAQVVQALLTDGVGKLVEDESIVEADVLLVIGEDYAGVTPAAGAAPETAAPETVGSPETTSPEDASTTEPPKGEQAPTPVC